ncbi:MAG: glycosyltransferase [Rhodospirillales bacterium]|nr:glycosyltransferase [Rhodospirillales bacterium]
MTPDSSNALDGRAWTRACEPVSRVRAGVFAVCLVLAFALCAVTGQFLATRSTPVAVMIAHGAMFAACILVWLAGLQASLRHTGLVLILAAVAARLVLLPFPASDDVNRYLWEGRLVLAGESPYAALAADVGEAQRDTVWEGINNKAKRTVYPPLAELMFAAAVALGYHPLAVKLPLVAAEIGILCLLLAELRRRRLPEANLALVAFNPVLLLGTAGEGHYDALFVLAMLVALVAHARGRRGWGWLALAVAVELKLVAILLVPLLLRRGGWRAAWIFLLVSAVPALPFVTDLPDLAGGLFAFGVETYHDGFLPAILRAAGLDARTAACVSLLVLALWAGLIAWRVSDAWRGAFLVLGGLLLLSPVVHVWYFIWIVPFLALRPQPAWLLASGLHGFYYVAWAHALTAGAWLQPAWAWWAQWAPFAVVLVLTSWPAACRLLAVRRACERERPPPCSISAVVPAYEEAEGIAASVRALLDQGPSLIEIIVVDGGSRDATAERAWQAGACVINGPRGRGGQIAAGIAVARGDVVWVVHADVRPAPGTAAAILGALQADDAVCGGAVGLTFSRADPLLLTIEALNAGRSALFDLSFGDQGQFVRRDVLAGVGGFPEVPLMEDVELALRLRRAGPLVHLGRNGIASSRRWECSPPLARIGVVLHFTARYLLSRRRARLAEDLFTQYYGGDATPVAPIRTAVETR